jgi:hypothetical protein
MNYSDKDHHLEYLKVYEYKDKIRYGNTNDGGYVCALLDNYDVYISIGVGEDESFSRDVLDMYNIDSYAFDGSISTLPQNMPNKIKFIEKYINTFSDDMNDNLEWLFSKYNNIFMKMDIEGAEYKYILSLDENKLLKIKQLVFELHAINDNNHYGSGNECTLFTDMSGDESYAMKLNFFKKMATTHYLVHVHANNGGGYTIINNNYIPNVIEVAYIRKDLIPTPKLNTQKFPVNNLDYNNYSHCPPSPELSFPPFCF